MRPAFIALGFLLVQAGEPVQPPTTPPSPIPPPAASSIPARGWLSDSKPTDVAIAAFTLALVIVSALQARRMRQSVDEMKAATLAATQGADAAKLSAETGIASQRAFMLLATAPTRDDNARRPLRHDSERPLHFANFGNTPAEVDSLIVSCRYWPNNALEQLASPPTEQEQPFFGVWVAGG